MRKINWIQTVLTVLAIFGITTALYLYSNGYRLEKNKNGTNIDLTQTGMVSAKSIPEGANVYLDGILVTATDDTVAGIDPGKRHLKISKEGYVAWEKEIEVFKELVTDITAVLVTKTPRIEPLTNTGAGHPEVSPTGDKVAYFSADAEKPGVMVKPLGGNLGFFKTNPTIAEDTKLMKYSGGKSIKWSPDESSIMIEAANGKFYVIRIEDESVQVMNTPENVEKQWETEAQAKRRDFIQKLELAEDVKTLALDKDTMWAPDNYKFLYVKEVGDTLEYRVHNLEKPLPIGEQIETVAFSRSTWETQPKISWYSDSFHLILVEGDVEGTNKGMISLIRIDGTNKTELYNNTLYSDKVYSTPGGDKVVIWTSFKSEGQGDLYTVSIR
jgi:hypothetical protein